MEGPLRLFHSRAGFAPFEMGAGSDELTRHGQRKMAWCGQLIAPRVLAQAVADDHGCTRAGYPRKVHDYNYNLSSCYPRRMADFNRNGMIFSSGDSPNSSAILSGGRLGEE